MTPRRRISLTMAMVICAAALPSQVGIPGFSKVVGLFGAPSGIGANDEARYLGTGVMLESSEGQVSVPGEGRVVFVQRPEKHGSGISASMPPMIVLSGEDAIRSVFSGEGFAPALPGGGSQGSTTLGTLRKTNSDSPASLQMRVFDLDKRAWVNPILFFPDLGDGGSPVISRLLIRGKHASASFQKNSRMRTRLPQGRYAILADVADMVRTNSVSGLYQFRVILDGQVAMDKRLDSAKVYERGLAFLGFDPPSSSAVAEGGMINIGEIELVRGQHSLEMIILDYAGNSSSLPWPLTVE